MIVDVFVAGRLERHGLRDDIGPRFEILSRIAGVLIIHVAVIQKREIDGGKSGGVDHDDISVVTGALLVAAIVGQHDACGGRW